jgi:hypothetical protein
MGRPSGKNPTPRVSRNAKQREHLVVPRERAQIHEQRARRVRHVRHVLGSAGELVDHVGVDGSERKLAFLRALPRTANVIEEPRDLGAREIRVEHEAGLLLHELRFAFARELLTNVRRAPALPHDRAMDRGAGFSVPHDRRLALVRDPDAGEIRPR